MTADQRRAMRSTVHAIGAIAMIGMLAVIVWRSENPTIIAMGLLAILFVREMMHGAENVTARVKFTASKDGISGEVGGDQ